MKFLRCEICGNIVEVIESSGVNPVCCDQDMTELVPGSVDGPKEKHVPIIEHNGNEITVKVGSEEHPMTDDHHIDWILLETNRGEYRKFVQPGTHPTAVFHLSDGELVVAAYEYCNLHGLWKSN